MNRVWCRVWVLSFLGLGLPAAAGEPASHPEPKPNAWLVGGFDRTSQWVTGSLVLGLGTYLAVADDEDIRSLGDAAQFIPGVAAAGVTLGARDWQGLKQFGLASGTAFLLTHGLKEVVDKTRPDDTADNSFPSGHTAASFTGSTYLWKRYGARWGAPASVLALYTGVSRVIGQKHFADDVISGASIGILSNLLLTHPIDDRVKLSLFPTRGGAGMSMAIDPSAPRTEAAPLADGRVPTRMFLWEIGGATVLRNDVSFGPGEPSIDFRFDGDNDPTATAFVSVVWMNPKRRYALAAAFAPFEVRERFTSEVPIRFPGGVVPASTSVLSRYVANDYRIGAGFVAVTHPRVNLTVGAGVVFFDTSVSLEQDGERVFLRDTLAVRPTVFVRLGAELSERWKAFSAVNAWSDSKVKLLDFTAQVAYRPHTKWALSLGYRRVGRSVESDEIVNTVDRNQVALGVWYLW